MEFTNEEMVKSLTSLIDETLEEIEEIKKSKFAASEISIGEDKSGIADKSKNGKLDAKKAEDEEDEDEDEEMDKADYAKKAEDCMDKAESCMDKSEDEDEEDEEEDEDEEEMKEAKKSESKSKKMEDKMKSMKKSQDEQTSLMKSYVDERFSSLEKTISKLAAVVESIADAPVQRKSVPANIAPLHKSTEEVETLSKTEVASKLLELKKSGKQVDSADIFKVETGNNFTALEIANKYGLR